MCADHPCLCVSFAVAVVAALPALHPPFPLLSQPLQSLRRFKESGLAFPMPRKSHRSVSLSASAAHVQHGTHIFHPASWTHTRNAASGGIHSRTSQQFIWDFCGWATFQPLMHIQVPIMCLPVFLYPLWVSFSVVHRVKPCSKSTRLRILSFLLFGSPIFSKSLLIISNI